jgi:hypothetical protein
MSEFSFRKLLQAGELQVPPLNIQLLNVQSKLGGDALLEVSWRGQSCRYVAELKSDAKPQTLRLAKVQAREWANVGLGQPMVIAPYLTSDKLDELLQEGISALDFCGNGAVEAPGRFFFYKTGNPNRYRESAPIVSAYRGDGSMIARLLLLQREFRAIGEIHSAIAQRRGSISMGTISKLLKKLESDLVIERPNRNSVRVLQPERALDGLLDAYRPPKIESTWTGTVAMPLAELLTKLQSLPRESDVVRTGESSAGEYAAWAGEPLAACYCRVTPASILRGLGVETKETRAFPNLRLLQTDDQRVYFDRRQNLAASPIQSWLEMAGGDKRQKEAAGQIRRLILDSLGA